jgi:hypothetical protein
VTIEHQRAAIDTAIGTTVGGTGVAVWLDWIQGGAATVAAVGGAVLVLIRLLIAWREWRNGRKV